MAINGIGSYGGFDSYKSFNIPQVDIETVKKQDEEALKLEKQASSQVNVPVETAEPKEDTRSRLADLDNISLNFNQGEDYSYIGSESDINNLDMQKAITDMRKDKILEDYQYFVGSSQNLMTNFNSEDGSVFMKF